MATLHVGAIVRALHTGGDTNPELFIPGGASPEYKDPNGSLDTGREAKYDPNNRTWMYGTYLPAAIVFVNGSRNAATKWDFSNDGVSVDDYSGTDWVQGVSIGFRIPQLTHWNVSDAYYVNNWPGTPYTQHKADGTIGYDYVTQVNYITGYICAASLH
ncbi:hypothetical protein OS324_004814 [Salmonella enterica]|nr:hypothetical protein [Salmonella enterica]